MGRKKSTSEVVLTWLFLIGIAVAIGWFVKENSKRIDVTHLVNASKTTIESELDVQLALNPKMVKRIYEYSEGELTVEGGVDPGIALLYIDNKRVGFHIDKKCYTLFGIEMGNSMLEVDDNLNYSYEGTFEVLDDYWDQGTSKGVFYYNETENDCLVIVYNDTTGRVVALTYYSNYRKATEELSGI